MSRAKVAQASIAIVLLVAGAVPACGDGPINEPPALGIGGASGAGGKGAGGKGAGDGNVAGGEGGGEAGAGVGGEIGEGGSSGSAGNAGATGSGGNAGSSGSAGSGGSGGTMPTLMKCEACEGKCANWQDTGYGTELCFEGAGTAQGGPAQSFPLALLCGELIDCMLETECAAASGELVDCYCGTSGTACQSGGANGECRDAVEAAAESTGFGDIGARFGDPAFALGRAQIVFDCYRAECPVECLPE